MKVTRQINIQRLTLFKWLNFVLTTSMWNLLFMSIRLGIPMGTNCAPLVADLLLYSCVADFVQHLQKSKFKQQKTSFILTFCYIDAVLLLNNPRFNDYIDVIYSKELIDFIQTIQMLQNRRLIPNYRVTSSRHVSSSRQLVTSARHVGLSR